MNEGSVGVGAIVHTSVKRIWKGAEMVEIGPFQEWLRDKVEQYGGPGALAEVTGIDERQLFTLLQGYERVSGKRRRDGKPCNRPKQTVSIDVVDRALLSEGSTFLWELYTDLYRWTPEQWDECNAELAALEAQDRTRGIDPLRGPEAVPFKRFKREQVVREAVAA